LSSVLTPCFWIRLLTIN